MRCLGSLILHRCWWLADCFTCLWSTVWVEGHPNHCGPMVSVITPRSYLSCMCMQKACFWWTVKRKMNCCNENIPSPRSSLDNIQLVWPCPLLWRTVMIPADGWVIPWTLGSEGAGFSICVSSPAMQAAARKCKSSMGRHTWDSCHLANWSPHRCPGLPIYTRRNLPRLVSLMAHTGTS